MEITPRASRWAPETNFEDEIPENKDASRPFFLRKTGEMGIYIDPVDAKAADPREFGLEHFFMMTIRENLLEYLKEVDLVQIKGALQKKNVFDGVILETVRKGLVLVATFDDTSGVESLWNLHTSGRLSPLMQEVFVNNAMLKAVGAVRLTIRAKLWEDEYESVKEELLARSMERVTLKSFENDIKMIDCIRQYQKILAEKTLVIRDLESQFELNLGEFMLAVKRFLPQNVIAVNSLKDFNTSIKVAKGAKKFDLGTVDEYTHTLEELRKLYEEVEKRICYPLSQIHGVCESDKQKKQKQAIKDSCREMQEFLKIDHNLQKVRHKEWEGKILLREKKLFYGLVSLVPMGLERLVDIDHTVDEYITCFPDDL